MPIKQASISGSTTSSAKSKAISCRLEPLQIKYPYSRISLSQTVPPSEHESLLNQGYVLEGVTLEVKEYTLYQPHSGQNQVAVDNTIMRGYIQNLDKIRLK